MDEYTNKLIEQYKKAKEIKRVDINSSEFLKEFNEWLKWRKLMSRNYLSFLDYMEVLPSLEKNCVEIGKGKDDSVSVDKNITIMTPYIEGIEKSDKLINADFEVRYGRPIKITSVNGLKIMHALDNRYFDRYITHNPYEYQNILDWDLLHNAGSNITIGVFGNTFDNDTNSKIKQLQKIKKNLDGDFTEDYATINDCYYYAIASTRRFYKSRVRSK